MHDYRTPVDIFLAIVIGYLFVSLLIGAKRVIDPWEDRDTEVKESPKS